MKPKISTCQLDTTNPHGTLGMAEFLTYLSQSDLFEVSTHNDRLGVSSKGERGTLVYYNDKRIYIDFWDYSSPTYSMEVFNANFDVIIKLQHPKWTFEEFDRRCKEKNMFMNLTTEQRRAFANKIVPWTFFCSRMMRQFIGKEDSIEKIPIEQLAFFCGKGWRCRGWYRKCMDDNKINVSYSDQETRQLPLTDDQFIHKMRSSKYGLCLHGRGSAFSEAKNRREIDYMILKKPLLLNYRPNYYNPMEEGKHYLYIDEKTSFEKLESMYNIEDIAKSGYEWYQQNATPKAVANVFKQIMEEKLK